MPKSKVRKEERLHRQPGQPHPVKVKAGPSSVWFVVLFVSLMLIGLVWLLVFQLAASGFDTPARCSGWPTWARGTTRSRSAS